jgi:hypothetical protein
MESILSVWRISVPGISKAKPLVILRCCEGDAVRGALQDPDERVRSSVLETAIAAGIQPPSAFLRNVVLKDTSVYVRCLALQALAGSPDAQSIAELAVNDPSEAVRAQHRKSCSFYPANNPSSRVNTQGQQPVPP